jgi:nucleoside 2-deoxyribosyltransferase
MAQKRIIYLACPYTHPDSAIREQRFQIATKSAAALIKMGHIVFSPLTMTHPIDVVLAGEAATLGSDYWVNFDEAFMDMCSEMIVLQIDGWDQSSGIRREVQYFTNNNKPVQYLTRREVQELTETARIGTDKPKKVKVAR